LPTWMDDGDYNHKGWMWMTSLSQRSKEFLTVIISQDPQVVDSPS
jgi:hypothetical protein